MLLTAFDFVNHRPIHSEKARIRSRLKNEDDVFLPADVILYYQMGIGPLLATKNPAIIL